ncbi:MAG: long-chain acyl-CoA synthetase [Streptosporangiaceae bacterium]|nr:long-chain acyl-CoA synthetase [Streptosporangiaceae bacterium]
MTSEVLRERAQIEESIRGQTVCDQLRLTAEQFPDYPALSQNTPVGGGPEGGSRDGAAAAPAGAADGGPAGWTTLTWAQARQQALELAAGFIALGVAPGERVAIMMPNRAEHVLADFAAVHAGAVPVTFYATLAAEQVAFVAGDCAARIAVLDGPDQLARWEPVLSRLPGLSRIIVRDPSVCPAGEQYLTWDDFAALGRERLAAEPGIVTARLAAITAEDPVTLLYTSGTTGNPKGVLLTHHCVLYEVAAGERGGTIKPHVRWVSYLPLAHIAERMFSIYLPVSTAGHVHFCPDVQELVKTVGEVRPTAFFGVPRVWEKIKAGIQALLAGEADPARRAAVEQAMDVGRRYVESTQYGRTTPDELAEAFRQADEQVLGPIRSLLGMGEADVVSSAAAPLPPEVAAFFAGLGMRILDIYGMTETTGAFTSNTVTEFRLGTVGRAFAGTEVMIGEDGEILTRGPLNTPGYLNRPDLTAELIDADGWLHTGDIGRLDDDGFLSVVDRKKELIITAGGENVPPAAVENLLVAHALIGQALAYGDRRPYLVALLTLDAEVAPAWAKARGIEASSLAALAQNPVVLAEIEQAVTAANQQLARVQQVKRWRLLPVEWTAESEELTPTLKLKRRVVHAKYSDDIATLYAG